MARRRTLFKSAGEARCDGMGMLICRCGGDLCICGDDGEDCFGCSKCEGRDDDYLEDDPSPEGRMAETHHQDSPRG